ncbi:MAG: hypothetical protein SGJ13_18420 [Actinomycetota bacterium]|nr:hypothetical protein [Actinomycetota bacterium]
MSDVTVDPSALLAELLLTPEGRADPYSRYTGVREYAPAFRSAMGAVVVGRYDDCQWILRDPRFGKGEPGARSVATSTTLCGAESSLTTESVTLPALTERGVTAMA